MIETTNILPLPIRTPEDRPSARDDAAPGFSFAEAVSALEARASKSLETHGAAPAENAVTKRKTSKPGGKTPSSDPHSQASGKTETKTSVARTPAAVSQNIGAGEAHPTSPVPAQPATAPVASAVPAVAAITSGATPAQTQSSAPRIEAAGLRSGASNKVETAKAPRPLAPTNKPQATPQDFAKLLARRLDHGVTKFELRLDPPDLGKVEAHLKLADNGDNILALKFEHQSTLDLFSQDQAALRTALSSSGFEFNGRELVFTLAENEALSPAFGEAAPFSSLSIEPQFAATWSAGVIDLTI